MTRERQFLVLCEYFGLETYFAIPVNFIYVSVDFAIYNFLYAFVVLPYLAMIPEISLIFPMNGFATACIMTPTPYAAPSR